MECGDLRRFGFLLGYPLEKKKTKAAEIAALQKKPKKPKETTAGESDGHSRLVDCTTPATYLSLPSHTYTYRGVPMPDDSPRQGAVARSSYRAALVLNGVLAACLLVAWLSMAWRELLWQSDFSAFYTGWSMVLGGDGARLYDLEAQTVWQHRVVPERGLAGGLLPFNYPPFLATVPVLALLSQPVAYYVWTLFQVALLVPMALLLRRLARDWGPNTFLPLLLTVLAFPPCFGTFQQGQLSLIVLVCVLGFYVSLRENRPWGIAVGLVVGIIKPQLMVIPAFTLLGARRWRAPLPHRRSVRRLGLADNPVARLVVLAWLPDPALVQRSPVWFSRRES